MKQLKQKINRFSSSSQRLKSIEIKMENSSRKSRTRTLIQAGGLLNVSGLLEYCNIKTGSDLQSNLEEKDKAAILLGILHDCFTKLPHSPSEDEINAWLKNGVNILKSTHY